MGGQKETSRETNEAVKGSDWGGRSVHPPDLQRGDSSPRAYDKGLD